MKLRQLYDKIVGLSKMTDPNVGDCYYGDVYQLNHIQTVKYPAVVVTNSNHSGVLDDYYFQYRVNIFYVDRLTDDQENKIDIHSSAITFLNTLVKELDEDLIVNNYEINCFNERFNDMCAGAYVSLYLKVPISECYETNGEVITNLTDIKITENGEYTAPYGTAYKNIDVDVPKDITLVSMDQDITENGEYVVETPEDADGMYEVNIHVDVQPKISEEYYKKLVDDALDEPLIIPKDTVEIKHTHFQSLNATTETICPLLEFPEGSISRGLGPGAFRYARIKKIIVPKSNNLNSSYMFANNPVLEEIIMHTNSYGGNMCMNCGNLKRVIYTSFNPYIAGNSFQGCTSLELVDLSKCTTVPTLASTNAFTNVPTSCEIRVPAALYDRWITKTNWSTLYAQGYNFIAV